jgi:hypothetical protein
MRVKEAVKREGWKGTTPNGRQVTYTCHERTPQSADITARIEGKEDFHVQLDVPFPITQEQVEARFAAELEKDS